MAGLVRRDTCQGSWVVRKAFGKNIKGLNLEGEVDAMRREGGMFAWNETENVSRVVARVVSAARGGCRFVAVVLVFGATYLCLENRMCGVCSDR